MKKNEIDKLTKQVAENLISDESFVLEIAKGIMSVKISDIGLQGPGTLLEFFRNEWQEDVVTNT